MEDIEQQENPTYKEKRIVARNGCGSLIASLLLLLIGGGCIALAIVGELWGLIALAPICIITACFICSGTMVIYPNEAINCMFCGKYMGTVRANGFFFVNPFYSKDKMSLKVQNFETTRSKVNDANGTPIEI